MIDSNGVDAINLGNCFILEEINMARTKATKRKSVRSRSTTAKRGTVRKGATIGGGEMTVFGAKFTPKQFANLEKTAKANGYQDVATYAKNVLGAHAKIANI
jgi:hypothetical protein